MAESIWREWWRRSGIPRTDFKLIIESGEWLQLSPGESLEMVSADTKVSKKVSKNSLNSDEGDGLEDSHPTLQDNYYYIVQGEVQCTPFDGSGRKEFTCRSGYFLDAFHLMSTLGQTSASMAMQTGPLNATVGRSRNGDEQSSGAIVIKWTHSTLVNKIVRSHGFAPLCLKTIVSSATLDSLYRYAVTDDMLDVYRMCEQKRKELVRGPLPKNAAMPQRSFLKQFWVSHFSWRDMWEPSPHQRVVNAISTGSRELGFIQEVKIARQFMEDLRQARVRVMATRSGA